MTRDQFLCEMMGECWHTWVDVEDDWPECSKCNCRRYHVRDKPNFSDWPDKGRLIDFVMADKEEWIKFIQWFISTKMSLFSRPRMLDSAEVAFAFSHIKDNFADLVFEYKGGVK